MLGDAKLASTFADEMLGEYILCTSSKIWPLCDKATRETHTVKYIHDTNSKYAVWSLLILNWHTVYWALFKNQSFAVLTSVIFHFFKQMETSSFSTLNLTKTSFPCNLCCSYMLHCIFFIDRLETFCWNLGSPKLPKSMCIK